MRDDIGKLIIRVTVGGLMLFHGLAKLRKGVAGIAAMLEPTGLPTFLAYGVLLGEVVAPILLILGRFTRLGAAILVINMVVAISMAHRKDIWTITPSGAWGIELQMLYLLGALAVCFLGSGRFALSRGRGRFD